MKKRTFVLLGFGTFALILLSFLLLGFGRLLFSYETARYLSAPTMLLSFALVLVLLVQSVLTVTGLSELQ
ncbi:hypothetical protein SAMN05421858_2543 [Haladaptatus litoreus]|uniref:Uncharacterized protein n=1 Tax=Haladaptatus litoreus TaxID=553468 RepID=A0A1N7BGS4_9EURY|nr:hypothetical protein [Haladaptatus litoreus]SIR50394.1 hypothetical protein SAMN05421858_2543 [Haladaptatus litoreus]